MSQLDFEKTAVQVPKFILNAIPKMRSAFRKGNPFRSKAKNTAWGWGTKPKEHWGTRVKKFMVGEPTKFMQELKQGKGFSRGSFIRRSMVPTGPLDAAMIYGFPAYETYHALSGPSEGRAARLGGALGGSLWLPTYRGLGLLGSSAAGLLGHEVGKGVGGLFDKAPSPQPNSAPQYY